MWVRARISWRSRRSLPQNVPLSGIEVVDVEGEIGVSAAPRLRELLIDLVSKDSCQLVVNMEKAEFLDSAGLGCWWGA